MSIFKRTPNVITVDSVIASAKETTVLIEGKWIPARPEGYWAFTARVKAAWKVFIGHADALVWDKQ